MNTWRKYETTSAQEWWDYDIHDAKKEWQGQVNVLLTLDKDKKHPNQWCWYYVNGQTSTSLMPLEGVTTLEEAQAVALMLHKME